MEQSETIMFPIDQHTIIAAAGYPDPLDPDQANDVTVVTTRRGLIRLALVASETAARFEREGVDHDPMAWMLAPRRLYGGRSAVDACLEQKACLRTVLLHGLCIGLDAEPQDVDELIDHDIEDDVRESSSDDEDTRPPHSSPKLFTSTLERRSEHEIVQRFDAIIAESMSDALVVLKDRHGAKSAGELHVREGFDGTGVLAEALLSSALSNMLAQVSAAPASPLARGLSVSIEQRFAE